MTRKHEQPANKCAPLVEVPAVRKNDGATKLVEVEGNFDRNDNGNNLAARASRRTESPGTYGFHGFFAQSHARILDDGNVHRAAVGRNRNLKHYRAHVLRLACIVRVRRRGAVDTFRHADSVHTSAKRAAARASAFTRTETAAGAAANTGAVAVAQRIAVARGEWVTEVCGVQYCNL